MSNPSPLSSVQQVIAKLRDLQAWFDSPERERFRHWHNDDGTIYTPYRVAAAKVRPIADDLEAVMASLPESLAHGNETRHLPHMESAAARPQPEDEKTEAKQMAPRLQRKRSDGTCFISNGESTITLTDAEMQRIVSDYAELSQSAAARPQPEERLAEPVDVAARRFVTIAKAAASDGTLTDAEVCNIVKYISAQPLTQADVARTHELAARFGWEPLPPAPAGEGIQQNGGTPHGE